MISKLPLLFSIIDNSLFQFLIRTLIQRRCFYGVRCKWWFCTLAVVAYIIVWVNSITCFIFKLFVFYGPFYFFFGNHFLSINSSSNFSDERVNIVLSFGCFLVLLNWVIASKIWLSNFSIMSVNIYNISSK